MKATLVHPEWTESPLVRFAFDTAGPDASTTDVLCTLSGMLNDLEDLAPGVSFDEIVQAWNPDSAAAGRAAVADGLARRGFDEDTIADLLGGPTSEPQNVYERHPHYGAIVNAYRAGETTKSIADRFEVNEAFVIRSAQAAGLPMRGSSARLARLPIEEHPAYGLVMEYLAANPSVRSVTTLVRRLRASGVSIGAGPAGRMLEAAGR